MRFARPSTNSSNPKDGERPRSPPIREPRAGTVSISERCFPFHAVNLSGILFRAPQRANTAVETQKIALFLDDLPQDAISLFGALWGAPAEYACHVRFFPQRAIVRFWRAVPISSSQMDVSTFCTGIRSAFWRAGLAALRRSLSDPHSGREAIWPILTLNSARGCAHGPPGHRLKKWPGGSEGKLPRLSSRPFISEGVASWQSSLVQNHHQSGGTSDRRPTSAQ